MNLVTCNNIVKPVIILSAALLLDSSMDEQKTLVKPVTVLCSHCKNAFARVTSQGRTFEVTWNYHESKFSLASRSRFLYSRFGFSKLIFQRALFFFKNQSSYGRIVSRFQNWRNGRVQFFQVSEIWVFCSWTHMFGDLSKCVLKLEASAFFKFMFATCWWCFL